MSFFGMQNDDFTKALRNGLKNLSGSHRILVKVSPKALSLGLA